MKIFKLLIILLLVGCQSQPSNFATPTIPKPTKELDNIEYKASFLAVGDNIMHDPMIQNAQTNNGYNFTTYYQNIRKYIESPDISFINQETILGGSEHGYSGYPQFNTPDEMANTLNEIGFDVVNGSTNHSFDMGESAVDHSIQVFKQYNNIKYIGLYQNQEEKNQIPVIEKNGIRIAFLSYNQYINYDYIPSSYRYNPFDKEQIKNDVEKAKSISDAIVVSCHWGQENENTPSDFQKEYAQYLADLGVDVIIGTHTHTLQNIEWLTGSNNHRTLVAYSLGNFISGMLEENCQIGGMLSFDFVKKGGVVSIENVVLTPLINHYCSNNKQNIIENRYGFTVYRLKDYTQDLASQHGLNGYNNITISIDALKQSIKEKVTSDIKINM